MRGRNLLDLMKLLIKGLQYIILASGLPEASIMHCDSFIRSFIKSIRFLSRIVDPPRRPPRAINHQTDIKVRGADRAPKL